LLKLRNAIESSTSFIELTIWRKLTVDVGGNSGWHAVGHEQAAKRTTERMGNIVPLKTFRSPHLYSAHDLLRRGWGALFDGSPGRSVGP
jgi:hypothetical protein